MDIRGYNGYKWDIGMQGHKKCYNAVQSVMRTGNLKF